MDLDGDGKSDMLSGSWPGEIYWFRRLDDGKFASGERLRNREGEPINVGAASAAFAVDWDADGDLDLVVGTLVAGVQLVLNEGSAEEPVFVDSGALTAGGAPLEHPDTAPVVADWDADGRLDLLVGTGDGSVHFYRNVGTAETPKLAPGSVLIGPSPLGHGNDTQRKRGDWGLYAKICVTDWNADGQLDLLLGDRCGGFEGKPTEGGQVEAKERAAKSALGGLRKKWADTFISYRKLLSAEHPDDPASVEERDSDLTALREQLSQYKKEIIAAQRVMDYYQTEFQSHGFVWVFLRPNHAESQPEER